MKRILLLLALSGLALGAQAEIYKWVDADGKIQYGDAPPKEAKTKKVSGGVMVVPAMVVPSPTVSAPVKAKPEPEARDEGVRTGGISRKTDAPAAPVDPDAAARAEARQRAIELCRQNRGSNCENEVDAQLYGQAGKTYVPVPVVIPGWSQPPIQPSNRRPAPEVKQSAPVKERESTWDVMKQPKK